MSWIIALTLIISILLILNLMQLLSRRSARQLADILYISSRRVRDKASEVRNERLEPEILEAHLLDIEGFVLGLQQALGRRHINLLSDSPIAKTDPPNPKNGLPRRPEQHPVPAGD